MSASMAALAALLILGTFVRNSVYWLLITLFYTISGSPMFVRDTSDLGGGVISALSFRRSDLDPKITR